MQQINVKVQASSTYADKMDEFVQRLKSAGMTIEDELKLIGHFSGSIDHDNVHLLREIPGVTSVDEMGSENTRGEKEYKIN